MILCRQAGTIAKKLWHNRRSFPRYTPRKTADAFHGTDAAPPESEFRQAGSVRSIQRGR
ncbi:hypothetical protein PT2222_10078 [Paraburkholderia tropica]